MSFSLADYAASLNVPHGETFAENCGRLRIFLEEANRITNLTRITEEEEFNIKHAADSLGLIRLFPELMEKNLRLADLGCGAGFPSLILALAFPHWQITAIDSTGKKVNFVRSAAEHLGLNNLTAVHGRVNELNRKKEFQSSFDVVTARAVAASDSLARDAFAFPAPDGRFIFYKTPGQAEEEMPRLPKAVKGFVWHTTASYELPQEAGTRLFVTGHRK
ncbi:MAG: 16S rRNA (guanine(527)-N(7))-methyltransferase RsmG [Lentisphaeria bacterium]|nr:16S rRNA (guanine(527)-N(7))-methyltransferase RsmG [Lentisphaeria bacterium]